MKVIKMKSKYQSFSDEYADEQDEEYVRRMRIQRDKCFSNHR